MLRAAEEPKLKLDGAQSMVSLQRFTRFSEGRWMSGHKLSIGGRSLSFGIRSPIATTSGVVHELTQQLSLLIPPLETGGDGLNQGHQRMRVCSICLRGLGISPSIASVDHAVIQMIHH
jgi:hypothetical protein